MKPKLVVFDIAGTTLNDREDTVSSAFLQAIQEQELTIGDNDIRWVMGYRKIEAIEMLLEAASIAVSKEKIEQIHNRFIEILNQHYRQATIREYDGISALFSELRQEGIRVALDTGFSAATTSVITDRLGWLRDGLVDAIISSDQVGQGRPHPDMIQALMQQFHIQNPIDVAKVGDTPSDLLEGKNSGCGMTIGVTYGTHTREELEQHPHDHIVSSVDELKSLLLR